MQWGAYSPRRRSGDKFGTGVVHGRGSESGGDPGHGKRLLHSSAESGAWRSSDSTAAQSPYAVEQGESGSVAAARVVGVAAKKDRVQVVRWVSLKGRGGVWVSVLWRAQA